MNIEGVRHARRGIDNVLKHFGILEGTPDTLQADGAPTTRHMQVRHSDAYSFAPRAGIFEPMNLAGDSVLAGEVAGWLHVTEDIDTPPKALHYQRDGVLWMSAGPGRVERGDTVAVVMEDYQDNWA